MSFAPTSRLARLSALVTLLVVALSVCAAARAQDEPKEPLFHDFKGVCIGMTAQDARQKLGNPTEKSDAFDFYNVSDKQTVQVYYDAGKVSAIAVMFTNAGADAISPKTIFGSEIAAKPDGSMYKMVRYQKAGFFVAYSRTAGDQPLVSVTIQKIK
jgi:outer membrane protein assembly factor BamE (lipoprotein component of BamABCDE complex)